ncbi:MAG: flavin reductase family protein [bacterium]|nr:flavin reductase family protein [bacterium]
MDLKALFSMTYGMFVVSSFKGETLNACTANTVFQVTSEPPTIAVSINKGNLTHEYISASKRFGVSIIGQSAPMTLIGNFGFKSGRDTDKFAAVKFERGVTGCPLLLEHTVASLEAEVVGSFDVGTHTIFWGNLIEAKPMATEEPMTYAYYHQVKRGSSPKAAPTFIPPSAKA